MLLRTLRVAAPGSVGDWPVILATLAALTMTVGNLCALRQTSVKRLLAYSSITQAGYLLVGVAAADRDALAVPGLLFYLAVYLYMNLGAFLAVDAIAAARIPLVPGIRARSARGQERLRALLLQEPSFWATSVPA